VLKVVCVLWCAASEACSMRYHTSNIYQIFTLLNIYSIMVVHLITTIAYHNFMYLIT
jgi:hypothetical protein